MISSFIPPPPNKQEEFPPIEIPINVGGSGRYMYNLNCGDQTVSVIDGATDTVISTITLTSSKAFASLFYRSLDQSVWVLGLNYFDRIDANEASGTFNTIVESGATIIDIAGGASYLTWPLDVITSLSLNFRWVPVKYINNSTEAQKDYLWSFNSSIVGQVTGGHHFGLNSRLHPKSKLIELTRNQAINTRFGKVLDRSKNINVNSPYTLTGVYHPSDLDDSAAASYAFGNFRLCTTSGAVYLIYTAYSYSAIVFLPAVGFGAGVYFQEYCPNAGRVFWASKVTYVRTSSFNIGKGTYTSVGINDRAAYKATNEDATEDMMYNPYNGKLYVQGKRHSTLTTGVNKVHVYDPTAVLASMYLSSITVGEMASTLRHGNYSLNAFCMNRTRYWEAPEVIY